MTTNRSPEATSDSPSIDRNDLDSTLLALAEPTRRGIVGLLSQRPYRAGELAEAFDMSPPAMSRHLRVLRTRGLIEEARAEMVPAVIPEE